MQDNVRDPKAVRGDQRGKKERTNIRIRPVEGNLRTHAQMVFGNDFTLCGFTLDGDSRVFKWQKETSHAITCEHCWAIIEFCRGIKQRKIASEKGAVTR